MHSPSENFPIQEVKRGGVPCEHLDLTSNSKDIKCKIHSVLEEQNFKVCSNYNCFGSGNYVTQLFESIGFNWLENEPNLDNPDTQKIETTNLRFGFNFYERVFSDLFTIKSNDPIGFDTILNYFYSDFFNKFNQQLLLQSEVEVNEFMYKYKKIRTEMIEVLRIYNFIL